MSEQWSNYLVHRRDHKYVGKVKLKSGRTRYFYSQQELQAYYDNLNRAAEELNKAEKKYEEAAKALESAISTASSEASRKAEAALSKLRRQNEEARRQRKKNQNEYSEATRRAQADAPNFTITASKVRNGA